MWNYLFIYFIIVAFLGWIYESIAMTIWDSKWSNRGFLFGPIIPIYGVGAVIGLILFTFLFPNLKWYLIFIIGVFGSAVLEWFTSVTLEKAFHAKWWDYSDAPFNIQGRICLFASIGFGAAALLIVYIINPFLWPLINKIPNELSAFISWILTVIFTADLISTIFTLKHFEDVIISADNMINQKIDITVDKIINRLNPKYITVIRKVLTYDYRKNPKVSKLLNEVKDKFKSLK